MAILHARNGRCCISSCNFFVSITATELYAISCHSYVKYIIIKQDEIKLNKKQKKDKKKVALFATLGYIILTLNTEFSLNQGCS